ncbi:MAG: DUF5606 domain-containing protein [Dysgonamonadaceae bacterium]|jgi:hypothetical protein|nr:DUF5606 domain-containing protein [Dysgonamonadaceae bacterium]
MLKEILSISGKPGLYKLVSKGKNMFITESLIDGKRVPAYARDKVVSLGDIAIYTDGEEIPLWKIFTSMKEKEGGKAIDIKPSISPIELRDYFAGIAPTFDRDRVYPTDIKKMMNWYNLLISKGFTDFEPKETSDGEAEKAEPAEAPKKEVKKEPRPTKAAEKRPTKQVNRGSHEQRRKVI